MSNEPVVERGRLFEVRVRWPEQIGSWDQFGTVTNRLTQGNGSFDRMSLWYAEFQVQYVNDGMIGPNMNTSLVGLINSNIYYDVGLAREAAQIHFRVLRPNDVGVSYAETMDGDHYIVLGAYDGTDNDNGTMPPMWIEHAFVRCLADLDPVVAGTVPWTLSRATSVTCVEADGDLGVDLAVAA